MIKSASNQACALQILPRELRGLRRYSHSDNFTLNYHAQLSSIYHIIILSAPFFTQDLTVDS